MNRLTPPARGADNSVDAGTGLGNNHSDSAATFVARRRRLVVAAEPAGSAIVRGAGRPGGAGSRVARGEGGRRWSAGSGDDRTAAALVAIAAKDEPARLAGQASGIRAQRDPRAGRWIDVGRAGPSPAPGDSNHHSRDFAAGRCGTATDDGADRSACAGDHRTAAGDGAQESAHSGLALLRLSAGYARGREAPDQHGRPRGTDGIRLVAQEINRECGGCFSGVEEAAGGGSADSAVCDRGWAIGVATSGHGEDTGAASSGDFCACAARSSPGLGRSGCVDLAGAAANADAADAGRDGGGSGGHHGGNGPARLHPGSGDRVVVSAGLRWVARTPAP